MAAFIGIDVHRKRSQVAVIDQDGQVLANRNVNIAHIHWRRPSGRGIAAGSA